MVEEKDFVENCMRELSENEREFIQKAVLWRTEPEADCSGHGRVADVCRVWSVSF